jgi:uncharacterized protein YjbI with pentapeptide repeats
MEPLNQVERRKSLTNFLLFFCLTVAIIVATVFFSMEVPFKHNQQMREQMTIVEKERDFAERFSAKMGETMNLLDSVNKNEVQSPEIIDNKIKTNVGVMSEMIENDSISQKSLYKFIVNTFAELRLAKKDLRDVSGKDANLTDLQKENAQLRNSYQQALDRYAQLQQIITMQQR